MKAKISDRRADSAVLLAAELFVIAMTLTAVAGFSRLFGDTTWVRPVVTAVLASHLTVAVVRRLGRGLVLSGSISLIAMTLQVSWTHYRSTLNLGLPTGTTRDAVDADLTAAWNLFSEVKAPTEPVVGFVVVASIAVWVIAYLADWAAFRLWSALEAVLPSFAIFVFIAFFGDEGDRLSLAGLYLAAVIGFQLFHRLMRQSHEVRWLAGTQLPGTSSLMRTGASLSVVVVLGALLAGPALPGAEQEAILDVGQSSSEPNTRVVVSPIVDIRGRLVQQADVEAFTVRSSEPSYWRLASLDEFDGQIWGTRDSYGRASGALDDDYEVSADINVLTQEFTIANMGAVWVPAAYEPRRIDSPDETIRYEAVSATLIVDKKLDSSNGLTYTIESEIPTFDPAALASAPDRYPPEIVERYLDLPSDFSPQARQLALDIVGDAGATNDYEEALALQNFFRDNFDYDLQVGAGHSSARIDEFLAAGVGYCEQFAGAFASMARSLRIPARVAVGFTWGDQDPADPNLYHVRGEHAHAWPEVYIPGSGWVPFEPTPTRGAPNAAAWTQVSASQANDGGIETPPPTPAPIPTPIDQNSFGEGPVPTPGATVASGAASSGGTPTWVKIAGLVLVAVLALVAIYSVSIIALKRSRTRRRFANADNNRDRVDAVWTETVESLRPLGLAQDRTETLQEFATRAGRDTVPAREPLNDLTTLAVSANYGPHEPADDAVEAAQRHRDDVASAVVSLTSTTDRLKDSLDPRPLVKR